MKMEFIKKKADQIVVGVPSKGRIQHHVCHFLESKGLNVGFEGLGRKLQTLINEDEKFKVVLMHPKDIPLFLEKDVLDIGFTGLDLLHERQVRIRPLIKLGVGKVKMSLSVPKTSDISHPFHLRHKRVGTSFPNIAHNYFEKLKVPVQIETIQGASEGLPFLGIVDAIMDVVETGMSVKENNLHVIDDEIFDSECICVVNKPEFNVNYRLVNEFLRRVYA